MLFWQYNNANVSFTNFALHFSTTCTIRSSIITAVSLIQIIFVSEAHLYLSIFAILFAGAVIIFTGLLSVAFLNSVMRGYRWLGMGLVTSGLIVVGVADIVLGTDSSKDDVNSVITGGLVDRLLRCMLFNVVAMFYGRAFLLVFAHSPDKNQ